MEIKFVCDEKIGGYEKYQAVIEELGITLKNIDKWQIKCIKNAQNTEYLLPLIETIKSNPKFDLQKFEEEMKLEDIVSDTPSKILLSAQRTDLRFREGESADFIQKRSKWSRIVTREQSDIIKQCIEKNNEYNVEGATEYNHGFDIETFGIDFISKLNNGLDDYTYNTIIQNKEVLEKVKANPEIANYIANAVNEYRKIQHDIEDAPKDNWWYYEDHEYNPNLTMSENEIRRKELSKKGEKFNKYNEYEDDIADLESLFLERLQQLENDEIKFDFEEYEYRYTSYDKGIAVDIDTLEESNAMEYLKKSGIESIEVSNNELANVHKNETINSKETKENLPVNESKFAQIYGKARGRIQEVFSKIKSFIKGKSQEKENNNQNISDR